MRHLLILLVNLITTVLRLVRPGGVRAVVAKSALAKHQVLILNRSRRRAANLRALDRLIAGLCSLWITPNRFFRVATAFKPSTLLNFHRGLVQRKYRLLFSRKQKTKPQSERSDSGFDATYCRSVGALPSLTIYKLPGLGRFGRCLDPIAPQRCNVNRECRISALAMLGRFWREEILNHFVCPTCVTGTLLYGYRKFMTSSI
jgi:hypothetical protein